MVYEGKDYSQDGIITTSYDLNDVSGDGQINFKIIIDDSYELDSINITGEYKNLKGAEETGVDNVYRITKITSDLEIYYY